MKKILLPATLAVFATSCGEKSDKGANESSTYLQDNENPGAAVTDISSAMGSIGALRIDLGLSGIANEYCNGNGEGLIGGTKIEDSENEYASATGYCQATHNAQSPDTARGAMYLAGGIACSVGKEFFAALAEPGATITETKTIAFSSPCWGSTEEAAAFAEDTEAESVDMEVSGERLAATAAYEYKISFTLPGDEEPSTLYIRSKDGVRAASFLGWAVKLDASDLNAAKIRYESISAPNDGGMTRTRLLIDGSLNADGSFSAVNKIQGFVALGGGDFDAPTFSSIRTFSGNLEQGLLGGFYSSGQTSDNDGAGHCYLPGSDSAACTGVEFIAATVAQGQSLITSGSASATALNAGFGKLIDFSTIDLSKSNLFE